MDLPEVLTMEQVARVLHIRSDSVVWKIKLGEIVALKVGHRWLIRKEILAAMLEPSLPQGA
jgi:excisionase family DNA binding protein